MKMICPKCNREVRVQEDKLKTLSSYPVYTIKCSCGYKGVWTEEDGWIG